MMATNDVLDLVRRWAAAEQQNDAGSLDGLLADDFVGVGPLGFVLTREQWLSRFGNGLENRAFAVETSDGARAPDVSCGVDDRPGAPAA